MSPVYPKDYPFSLFCMQGIFRSRSLGISCLFTGSSRQTQPPTLHSSASYSFGPRSIWAGALRDSPQTFPSHRQLHVEVPGTPRPEGYPLRMPSSKSGVPSVSWPVPGRLTQLACFSPSAAQGQRCQGAVEEETCPHIWHKCVHETHGQTHTFTGADTLPGTDTETHRHSQTHTDTHADTHRRTHWCASLRLPGHSLSPPSRGGCVRARLVTAQLRPQTTEHFLLTAGRAMGGALQLMNRVVCLGQKV